MNGSILLQKKENDRIVQVPCEIDLLTSNDENEVCSFYNMTAKLAGGPEVFVPEHTLPSDLAGDGIVLGVRAEGRLICVRVSTFNRDVISEYREELGGKFEEIAACSDGCIVDSRYRGNKLQQLTWFRMEPLLHGKCDCVYATVSPKNPFSLKNVFSCGYVVIARLNMYGGYERFVVRKRITGIQCINTAQHIEINLHDGEKMAAVLSEGYVGYKMMSGSAGVSILFGQEE
ncbi:MAG: hypothetical protein FWE49_02080 [Synergistaceae bacterium]|nr:hypothetical protein [Synergistaceae bacterium]